MKTYGWFALLLKFCSFQSGKKKTCPWRNGGDFVEDIKTYEKN